MEDKGSFVVYTDIKEIVDELTDEQVATLFRSMLDYQITGKDTKLTGTLKYIFIPIRQQMDRDAEKWERIKEKRAAAGRIGGQRSAETRAKQNEANQANATFASSGEANEANQAVTVTVTDTVTVNGDVTGTVSDSLPDAGLLSFDLIQYLNEKTGSDYKADKANAVRVQSLLDSGYTPLQLRTVIDKKCDEWMADEKMRPYLRPSTLFGDKFGEYLAAPISITAEKQKKADEDRATLERQLSEKRTALADMKESLKAADKTERKLLRENIAILEDSIGLIERRLT